jgi:hypothetical protein
MEVHLIILSVAATVSTVITERFAKRAHINQEVSYVVDYADK